jgi:chromosome segregation ATPase
MSEEELMLFSTSLRQVFSFIRHSGDKDSLIRVTNEDTGFRSMDRESVEIINMVTGANIRIRKREEKINVCKAIDDLVKEKDTAVKEKDTAVKEKFILLRERDEILRENDDIRRENDDIRKERDDLRRERDDARRKNDDIRKERDDIRKERDDARRENDNIRREIDDIRRNNDDIRKERDDARRNTLNEQCSILRSIMQKLSVSASEAMNIAGIPEEKRPLLAAELTKTAKA